jgi:anti-sigma factor RsiW
MLCQEIENSILDYLENQLSAARRAEVEAHLAGCTGCREFARQLQRLDAALSARVRIPALSANFDRRLRERIQPAPAALSEAQRAERKRQLQAEFEAQRAERKRQLQAEFEAGMARISRRPFALGSLLNHLAWPALAAVAGWLAWHFTAQWTARLNVQSLGGLAPDMIPWLAAGAILLAVGLAQAFPRFWRFPGV